MMWWGVATLGLVALVGLNRAGCPFHASLGNSKLDEVHARNRRNVNFNRLNCPSDWAPCNVRDKYRHLDGRCNNLENRSWGSAVTPHSRWLHPEYMDNIGTPRQYSASGSCLPTPRQVSRQVHMLHSQSHMKMSSSNSHMLMSWGQFIDHDVVLTPQAAGLTCCAYSGVWREGEERSCHRMTSSRNISNSLRALSRASLSPSSALKADKYSDDFCIALKLDEGDNTYGEGHTCINLHRSVAVPADRCNIYHREQINSQTAYIDGSMIYGSDTNLAWELRTQEDGLLLTSEEHQLPKQTALDEERSVYGECARDSPTETCFKAGDERVNVQPGLASLHTLFVMEHNRIAKILKPQIESSGMLQTTSLTLDEVIYQEARRIVAAQLQHITYNEFLPVLLGPRSLWRHTLKLNIHRAKKSKYTSRLNPNIKNEFATVAYRVGHTLIPEGLMPLTPDYVPDGTMANFLSMFQNPHLIYQHGVAKLLRGIVSYPVKDQTARVNHELEKVFPRSNASVGGIDLVAVNIQRGREHGIPSYTKLRQKARLRVPSNFDELDMPADVIENLKKVYESVEDIDAWTGAVSENKEPGSMVGPLNTWIIGRQFRALKLGDRFWYEFQQPNVGFTDGQLSELYKVSLSRILCDNLDMSTIQPQAFFLEQSNNKRTDCSNIPTANFTDWFNI